MKGLTERLGNCVLFNNMDVKEVVNVLNRVEYRVNSFGKEGIIAHEGEECTSLGIVLEGYIEVRKTYASGKTVVLTRLNQGSIFGEAIIFSKLHRYPSTIVSMTDSKIMHISRRDVIALCSSYPSVLERFMEVLSERILMLSRKVRELSYETLRHKICSFIMEMYEKQKSNILKVPITRQNMAEYLGVQRPSLSRELIRMKEDGLIDFDRDTITIKDINALEEFLT